MKWHPISSAPKDGTVILLRRSRARLCGYAPDVKPKKAVAVGYYDGWWISGVPGGHSHGGEDDQFTHWMAIPEPPTEGAP